MSDQSLWQQFLHAQLNTFLSTLQEKDKVTNVNIDKLERDVLALGKSMGFIALRKHIKPQKLGEFEQSFTLFKAQKEQELWSDYLANHLLKFLSSIPESTYLKDKEALVNADSVTIKEWQTLAPKALYSAMRAWLPQASIKQFQNRYRAYKHRGIKRTDTIDVSPQTKAIIDMAKAELHASNYDEVFELLFSKHYNVSADSEVRAVKEQISNALPASKNLFLEEFMLRLNPNDRNRVKLLIENTFNEGWDRAKACRKRKGDPRAEALVDCSIFTTAANFSTDESSD